GIPLQDDFLHRGRKSVLKGSILPEHVGIPPDHLVIDAPRHGVEIEASALLGEPGVKDHLKQDIA
ncbi:hypothetical protein SB847_21790, partial [Bacillus sp. SIMBA_026]